MLSVFKRSIPREPLNRTINIGERTLPLKIRSHKRASRITLRIDPGGRGLSLTVPPNLPSKDIDAFLEKYHGWLITKLAKFPKYETLEDGGVISIRGVDHRIERTGKIRGITEIVRTNGDDILRVGGDLPHLRKRIARFLKTEAKADLEEAVSYHAEKLGRSYQSISLKDTKSRWGSCTSDGKLSFSWRIIMAPPFVLDYLAAHEVSHLVEMNHSPRFWQTCENLCPHTKEAKRWLKKHGSLLHAVDFG